MAREISVVVTAFNVESYIDRALSSVLDQEFGGIEIIFVDDGSSDRTLARASQLLKGWPDAQIIAQANAGPGAARNAGLLRATGEYVLFLDGDDWIAPGSIKALSNARHEMDIVLSNRRRYWDASGKYTTEPVFTEVRKGAVAEMNEVMKIIAIHGKLFRRDFLVRNKIFFPVGMSSEDFVFSYHAYALAEAVATIPTITYFYRKRADGGNQSLTQARLTEFNLTSRFKQIEMTQTLVKKLGLKKRFPKMRFERVDFDARLMRHVKMLPHADEQARQAALGHLRAFLTKHQEKALKYVTEGTRNVYRAILEGNDELVLELLERNARAPAPEEAVP